MMDLVFSDPVAWGSLLGIGIMLVMSAYFVYMFLHNSKEDV